MPPHDTDTRTLDHRASTRVHKGRSTPLAEHRSRRKPDSTVRFDALAQLPQHLTGGHGRTHGKVETARAFLHRDEQAGVGGVMNAGRRTDRFPSEKKNVAIGIGKIGVVRLSSGGEEKETAPFSPAPALEGLPRSVAHKRGALEIVHAGPLQVPVGQVETRRLDQVDGEAEAGGETEYGPGISGNVWLVERDTHLAVSLDMAGCGFPVTLPGGKTEWHERGWQAAATVSISPSLSTRTEGEKHGYASTLHDLAPRLWPEGLTADSVRHASTDLSGSYASRSVGITPRFSRTFAMHNRFPRRPFGRNNDFVVPQIEPTRPTLQDRRLEAWALTIGATTMPDQESHQRRPHRGQLPDVDMKYATPERPALWTMLRKLFQ